MGDVLYFKEYRYNHSPQINQTGRKKHGDVEKPKQNRADVLRIKKI